MLRSQVVLIMFHRQVHILSIIRASISMSFRLLFRFTCVFSFRTLRGLQVNRFVTHERTSRIQVHTFCIISSRIFAEFQVAQALNCCLTEKLFRNFSSFIKKYTLLFRYMLRERK